jgi:uncharacterized damage-inducible protein DinB
VSGGRGVHVTTHGTHHCAKCLNMLRQLRVKPFPPSSFAKWTEPGDAQTGEDDITTD